MSEPTKQIQVVVGYDFSPSAELALQRAVEVVARAPQHILHIVTAIDARHGVAVLAAKHVDFAYTEQVEALVVDRAKLAFRDRQTASEVQFFVHARLGKPADEILHVAHEVGADLIFVGSHGATGIQRLMLGSVSERVVREAACPVMVVRDKTYAPVELARITRYDHDRKPYAAPHRYAPADRSEFTRPNAFPIS